MSRGVEEIKKQEIADNLKGDASIDANNINVKVQGDTAILEGNVSTYSEKMKAARDAYRVPGVTSLENKLVIMLPESFQVPSDAEITENIRNKLKWNSQVNSENIDVQTDKGVVTLSGEVQTYWEKSLAEDITVSTSGIVDVINNLSVTFKKAFVDIDIKKDIEAAYKRSIFVDESNVNVNVDKGVVTLTGTVPDYDTKSRAYGIAKYTSGVVDVKNNINIA